MLSTTYNRYLWLLNKLLLHKRMSLEELQEHWERSHLSDGKPLNQRTFHKHRLAVEEMFNISINCDKTSGYKYYIDESSLLQKDLGRQWLLNSFTIGNLMLEGKTVANRIVLERIPGGVEHLPVVIEALKQNLELEVSYLPHYKREATKYRVKPFALKVHNQRWYLLVQFDGQSDLKVIALDRIMDVAITDIPFTLPPDFTPEDYFKDSVGIWVNEKVKPERVVIRVYGQQCKYLRDLPLHPSQKEVSETEEYSEFQYQLSVTNELVRELTKMGGDIEVVRPQSLREKLTAYAYNIIKRNKIK